MSWTRRLVLLGAIVALVVAAAAPMSLAEDDVDEADGPVVRTVPAEPVGGGVLDADCLGCYAWSWIDKDSAWPGVNVRAKTRNHASEIIYRQNAHLALIAGSACYQGDYKYTGGTGDQYNIEDGSVVDSGWRYGGHGWWTNANGHNWWDDGQHYAVSGDADICRQY